MRLGVVGGTGLVGTEVVAQARRGGVDPVVIARSTGVDLISGAGLEAALDGCDAVVDVSNTTTLRARPAVRFFSRASANLVAAAARVGIGHLVCLSIVGSDVVDLGYYRGKRAQEAQVRAAAVGWTVVRATQFFEFPEPLLATRSPVALVPRMRCRPVAVADVATVLCDIAQRGPAGETVLLAGPGEEQMVDMARRIVAARGRRTRVWPIRLPGAVGAAMAGGGLLPQGDFLQTQTTFADHLAGLRA